HEFLERHHLEFVLRGHGRLQHHAIKKQKPPTWRGFVSNLNPLVSAGFFFSTRFFCHAASSFSIFDDQWRWTISESSPWS
ncbi:hypothetical protein, partial [Burkholderia pseudomallei]